MPRLPPHLCVLAVCFAHSRVLSTGRTKTSPFFGSNIFFDPDLLGLFYTQHYTSRGPWGRGQEKSKSKFFEKHRACFLILPVLRRQTLRGWKILSRTGVVYIFALPRRPSWQIHAKIAMTLPWTRAGRAKRDPFVFRMLSLQK